MNTDITSAYQSAKTFALVQQGIVLLVSALILDGGDVFHTCLGALAAFWIGAAIIGVRRPQTPTKLDLALIRFGYIPLCILAYLSVQFVWRLRGL